MLSAKITQFSHEKASIKVLLAKKKGVFNKHSFFYSETIFLKETLNPPQRILKTLNP